MPETARMNEALAVKYGVNVPRYTSYPTAPHFSAAVDARTYESWLDALDAGHGVSLYLHVPFCRRMCWFCGCHTKITRRDEPIARYARHLESELALVRTASRYGERLVTHDATLAFLVALRTRLFRHFAALDPQRLARLRSGEILARITADVDNLDHPGSGIDGAI